MSQILHVGFDWKVVWLSVGISFLGSYITICLCEQLRLSEVGHNNQPKLLKKHILFVLMSCSLGGVGIWCMHFVGMSGLQLKTVDGENVYLHFDIFRTFTSLLIVLFLTLVGLYVSSHDVIFRKTKSEVVEMFVESSKSLTFRDIQNLKTGHGFLWIVCTRSLLRLLAGGLCTGSGVIVMHYLGMSAIDFPGEIRWNGYIIFSSLIIALVASTVAFWILFRLLSLYPQKEVLRFNSAAILTIAVCGMHYTGMAAATFHYDSSVQLSEKNMESVISAHRAFHISFDATMCFAVVLLILIMCDLRTWLNSVSNNLKRADDLVAQLQHARSPADVNALLMKYIKTREHRRTLNGESSPHSLAQIHPSSPSSVNSHAASASRNLDNHWEEGEVKNFIEMPKPNRESSVLTKATSSVHVISGKHADDNVFISVPLPLENDMNLEVVDVQSVNLRCIPPSALHTYSHKNSGSGKQYDSLLRDSLMRLSEKRRLDQDKLYRDMEEGNL